MHIDSDNADQNSTDIKTKHIMISLTQIKLYSPNKVNKKKM